MSQKIALLTLTVTASGAVAPHRFVGFDGAVAGAGAKALGVSTFKAGDGQDLAADVIGTTVIETGGAIAVGEAVTSDASGRAAVVGAEGGDAVNAHALDSATGAGEFIEVLLVR